MRILVSVSVLVAALAVLTVPIGFRLGETSSTAFGTMQSSGTPPPDAPTGSVTTYQLNALHDGHGSGGLSTPLSLAWSLQLGGTVSYPLVVNERVFVATENPSGQYGAQLYAIDEHTGSVLWGPIALSGTYFINGIAADGANVYSINFDGLLRALDQATGQEVWQKQLPGQYAFTSPPTVSGGKVFVGGAGSGGTLYAVSAATGSVLWTAGVANGDHSSPAVTADAVYVSYACEVSYRFDQGTGHMIWVHTTDCAGGGGRTPVVHGECVYVRDDAGKAPVILQTADGSPVGTFSSFTAPAFDGDLGFYTPQTASGAGLAAVDLTSGLVEWSQTGDGGRPSAPLVIDGKVAIGWSSGMVALYDEHTGALVWSANTGAPINFPDEHNARMLAGLAAADGMLFVPSSTSLVAYRSETAPIASPTEPLSTTETRCLPKTGTIGYVAIDADPSGVPANTATSLGSRETCVSASVGDLVRVDITQDEVPQGEDLEAWQAELVYDPEVVWIHSVDDSSPVTFMNADEGGSVIPVETLGDAPGDADSIPESSDGSIWLGAVDFGPSEGQVGEGVLGRLTLKTVGVGTSALIMRDAKFARLEGYTHIEIGVGTLAGAAVAVDDPDGCLRFAVDNDLDGICNPGATSAFCAGSDNCQWAENPGQENIVHPGTALGDACEDPDFDRLPDGSDNCPDKYNPGQLDGNADGVGDDCTADLAMLSLLTACSAADEALPFACIITAGIVNLGPQSTARARGAVNVGFPSDCSVQNYAAEGQGFGALPLGVSVSRAVSRQFWLTCLESGPHQIVDCVAVDLADPLSIDPNPYNNFASSSTIVTVGDGSGPLHTAGRCTVLDPPEVCGDGIDNDNDGLVDEEPDTDGDGLSDCVDTDDDGDGFPDAVEAALGTDPLSACPIVVGAHAAWPPDFNDDRSVDLNDVLALKPVYGATVPAASPRYDLDPSGAIDISDVLALKPFFGASCAP